MRKFALFLSAICYTHAQVPLPTNPAPIGIDGINDPLDRLLFRDLDVNVILDMIEIITGFEILHPQNLPAIKISFDSGHVITKKEAILALENLLSIHGMGIVHHGDQCLKLVPSTNMNVDDLNKKSTIVTSKIYVPLKNEEQTLNNGSLLPFPQLPQWSKFKYNSPEEKEYWDKLPDWSDKFKNYYNQTYNRNTIGESLSGQRPIPMFRGGYYVKSGDYCTRTILEYFRGYIVRSKTLFYNGQNQEQCNYKMGKLHGLRIKWYHNGQKQEQGNYKEGGKEGLWEKWHYNGQKLEEGNYKEGKKEGLWEEWHYNGQKERECNYKKGKEDGLIKRWSYRGQKTQEFNCKEGKWDGLNTCWYNNGQKRLEENFKNGVKHGICLYWYESGQKKLEEHWKDSLLMFARIWKPNGAVCSSTDFKDGNGIMVLYYNSGQKKTESNYQNGKRNGLETNWYKNGAKKSESNYNNGQLDGDLIEYDKSGAETFRSQYIKGILKPKIK